MILFSAPFLYLNIKPGNIEETPTQTNEEGKDWDAHMTAPLLIPSSDVALAVNPLQGGVRPEGTFLRQC